MSKRYFFLKKSRSLIPFTRLFFLLILNRLFLPLFHPFASLKQYLHKVFFQEGDCRR